MAEATTGAVFKLRELQAEDDQGRQFVIRVDDYGDVQVTGVFDRQGKQIKLPDGEKIEIAVTIKRQTERSFEVTLRLCGPYLIGGVWKYVAC